MAIAYFYTWTTYGTWLPGDSRGWIQSLRGEQAGNARLEFEARLRMKADSIRLNPQQRLVVEKTIADHCLYRGWELRAVNCRSNHAHVVVAASEYKLAVPRLQFKAWCTRRLKGMDPQSALITEWWTERGWDEYIDNDRELEDVMNYVIDGQ